MSSRRSSAVATAESSVLASRATSPNVGDDVDVSMGVGEGDESAMSTNGARGKEGTYDGVRSRSGSRSGSLVDGSYIQRIPQLDIAFLHAISSHRPLGPHKHFNLIPVLVTLDRVIRQVGAQARDSSRSRELDNDEEDAEADRRSEIKREEDEEDQDDEAQFESSLALQVSNVDAEMVWQRLEELYDVEGLEELEDQTVDADDESPFHKQPDPTFVSKTSRKTLGNSVKVPASFGFGSKLARLPETSSLNGSTKSGKTEKQKKTGKAKAAAQEDEEDEERILDFELGPWEEYEELIAPRRLKNSAQDEEGHSESDGELSGYSGAETGEKAKYTAVKEEEDDDAMEEGGEERGEDDADNDEENEDDEEEGEEEAGEGEEEEQTSSKRKGSSLSKKVPPSSRQKRSNAGGSSTPTPTSAAPPRSSRSSVAAKPRRSGRR